MIKFYDGKIMGERGNSFLKALDKYLGIPLTLFSLFFRKFETKSLFLNSNARIGILCFGAIGDLLLLTALIDGIRKQMPNAFIEVIASNSNSQVLSLLPGVDSKKAFSIKKIFEVSSYLRKQKYDLLLDSSQWIRIGNLLANFSRAGNTVGFRTAGQYRSLGYNFRVRHRNDLHEVENFLNLGRSIWPDLNGIPNIELNSSTLDFSDEFLNKTIFCHTGCAPGKFSYLRYWPESYWKQLIAKLAKYGFNIILTGTPEESERIDNIISDSQFLNTNIINYAGKADLPRLACMFSKSAAVVSINTGVMHLAVLSGTKVIDLTGPTNMKRWGAWGSNSISLTPVSGHYGYLNLGFEFPDNPEECMQNLPVQLVLDALKRLSVI